MLAVFGIGCITGLLVFSRIVSAAFEKYHDATLALLSGFMLGSLNKIWPWRNPTQILDKDTGRILDISLDRISNIVNQEGIKVLTEESVFPGNYYTDPKALLCHIALLVGMALVFILSRFQGKN
jgi:putative membrane protein